MIHTFFITRSESDTLSFPDNEDVVFVVEELLSDPDCPPAIPIAPPMFCIPCASLLFELSEDEEPELLVPDEDDELLVPAEDVSSSYDCVIEPISIVPLSVIPTVRFPFFAVFSLVTVAVFVSSFFLFTLKKTITVMHTTMIMEIIAFFIFFLCDLDFTAACFFSLSAIFIFLSVHFLHYSD